MLILRIYSFMAFFHFDWFLMYMGELKFSTSERNSTFFFFHDEYGWQATMKNIQFWFSFSIISGFISQKPEFVQNSSYNRGMFKNFENVVPQRPVKWFKINIFTLICTSKLTSDGQDIIAQLWSYTTGNGACENLEEIALAHSF